MNATSTIPFDNNLVPAIAIYCSDGRFIEQYDEFLRDHCDMAGHNRIAIPGGAGCLGGAFEAYRERESLLELFSVLGEAHQVKRVVLIGHSGCAYYQMRLGVSPDKLIDRIKEDLGRARQRIRETRPVVEVETYIALASDDSVSFESV